MPPTILDSLLASAGHAAAAPSDADWRLFVEHVVEALNVGPGTGVYDIACGAGAFLYPLWENGYRVGGLGSSPALVARAQAAMPDGRFALGDAVSLDPGEGWDVVVAVGVLGGLRDADEARGVLSRMAAKATHAVALLDIPEAAEAGAVPGRLGYDRGWMLRTLAGIGMTAVQFEEAAPEAGRRRFHVFAQA